MKCNKLIAALAVSLLSFSSMPLGFAATSSTSIAKSSILTEQSLASHKQMYIEIEFLKGTESDGANVGIMAVENKGGAVGVGLHDTKNPKNSSDTSIEAIPSMRSDGKVGVEVRVVKAKNTIFEGCTIAKSGDRVIIDGNGVSFAVIAFNQIDTQAIRAAKEAAQSSGDNETHGDGVDFTCIKHSAYSAFGLCSENA